MSGFSQAVVMALAVGGAAIMAPPAHAEGFMFDCDTPTDHFSKIVQPVKGTNFRLSGTMASDSLRSGKFLAVAQGGIVSLDDKSYVRAQLVKSTEEKNTLLLVLLSMIDGERKEFLLGKTTPGTPVGFDFSVRSTGNIIVKFAGREDEIPLKLVGGAKLLVGCSTGDFTFTDVKMEERAQE